MIQATKILLALLVLGYALVCAFFPDHPALVTPFGSIGGIAQRMFWFLPVSVLIRDSYTSTAYVSRVQARVTILVAERDEVIPAWSTQELIARFEPVRQPTVVVLKGRGHNDVQADAGYWHLIAGSVGCG